MLGYITLLLVCQLAGEVLARLAGWPIPGPVVGMAILFIGLILRGGLPKGLDATASGLLRHLSLLFVPAGSGVMLHAALLGREWLPISLALVVSTLLTIAVTGVVMQRLARAPEDQP